MRNRIRIQDKDKNNTGEYVKIERREDTDRDRLRQQTANALNTQTSKYICTTIVYICTVQ